MIGIQIFRALSYRYRLFYCASVLTASFSANGKTPQSNVDHLVPVDEMVIVPYQLLLARNLYVTPANYGRVVVIPSSGSGAETAISLHSGSENAEGAVLTWTQGDREIWTAASDVDPTLSHNPQVKINRADIPFPKRLATIVSQAMKVMVEHTKEPTSSDRVVLHGTHVLFMIDDAKGRTLQGRLAPESRGKNASALRALTEALAGYCRATPDERTHLRMKIETAATRLTR